MTDDVRAVGKPEGDWLERCPSCGGELDTGWECNDCGKDWQWLSKELRPVTTAPATRADTGGEREAIRNLLAVIFRDGGHRLDEIGDVAEACDVAQKVVTEMLAGGERERLEAASEAVQELRATAGVLVDAANKTLQRLDAALAPSATQPTPASREREQVRLALGALFSLPNWENRCGEWKDINEALRNLHDAALAEKLLCPT